MKDAEWIVEAWYSRRSRRDPHLNAMEMVKKAYEGDIVVPLPEVDQASRPAVANTLMTGIDHYADIIGGSLPTLYYTPLIPSQKRSMDRADIARKANLSWWEQNRVDRLMRRRARYLVAYASAPVMILPDYERQIPGWHGRDPLTAFPAESMDPDEIRPADCIFAYRRSAAWLQSTYPDGFLNLRKRATWRPDDLFDCLEYVDGEERVFVVVGDTSEADRSLPYASMSGADGYQGTVRLSVMDRYVNRLGECPVVMPTRITLSRPQGQFDQIIPLYKVQAQLQALELIAVEKSIFKDAYLVSRPNEQAKFVAGPFDGRTGQVNIVEGGMIEYVGGEPNPQTNNAIDRLERNQRVMSGVSAEMGGESQSNVRTGRRGESIMSTQIDPKVQAAQEEFEHSLREENKIAIATAKKYFGNKSKSFYVNWKGSKGPVDYIPNRDFDTDNNRVIYPHAGMDQSSLIISVGQLLGEGLISKRTAQDINPLIENPEFERDWSVKEQLEAALLQGLQQQVSSGSLSVPDLARISELVSSNKQDLVGAVQQVHQEAQARQASDPTAQPGDPAAPADPNSPDAQPGLAPPGAAPPGISPPPPSQQNLSDVLNTLRRPQRMSPAEQGAA